MKSMISIPFLEFYSGFFEKKINTVWLCNLQLKLFGQTFCIFVK